VSLIRIIVCENDLFLNNIVGITYFRTSNISFSIEFYCQNVMISKILCLIQGDSPEHAKSYFFYLIVFLLKF